MQAITDILSLLWQPVNALASLRQRAPFWQAFVCAWLAALVYVASAQALAGYAQGGSPLDFVAGNQWLAARTATMLTLFVAAWYAPFTLWLGNAFGARAKNWRTHYRSFATCALAALCAALLATLLPAIVIGWQARALSSEAIVGFFILVLTMPLPILAALMMLALSVNLSLSRGRAAIVVLLTLWSFVILLVLQQIVWLIVLLALLMAYFLRARAN